MRFSKAILCIFVVVIFLELVGYLFWLWPEDDTWWISGLVQVVQWLNWLWLWSTFQQRRHWTCVEKCDVWVFFCLFNAAGIANAFLLGYELLYIAYVLHVTFYLGSLLSLMYLLYADGGQ